MRRIGIALVLMVPSVAALVSTAGCGGASADEEETTPAGAAESSGAESPTRVREWHVYGRGTAALDASSGWLAGAGVGFRRQVSRLASWGLEPFLLRVPAEKDLGAATMPTADGDDGAVAVGAATPISLLWGEHFRAGVFVAPGVAFTTDADVFLQLQMGLEVGGYLLDEQVPSFIRVFAQPWISTQQDAVSTVFFGIDLLLGGAWGSYYIDIDADTARGARARMRSALADVLPASTSISSQGVCELPTSAWGALACTGEGMTQPPAGPDLPPGHCRVLTTWTNVGADVDLRTWLGGAATTYDAPDPPVAAVQDTADDGWPVVVLCNPATEARTVHLQGVSLADEPSAAIFTRYADIEVPEEEASSQCPAADEALAAGKCCTLHLGSGGSEQTLRLAADVPSVSARAPAITGTTMSVVLGTADRSTTPVLRWNEARSVVFTQVPNDGAAVRFASGATGAPVIVCAAPATQPPASAQPAQLPASPPAAADPEPEPAPAAGPAPTTIE